MYVRSISFKSNKNSFKMSNIYIITLSHTYTLRTKDNSYCLKTFRKLLLNDILQMSEKKGYGQQISDFCPHLFSNQNKRSLLLAF